MRIAINCRSILLNQRTGIGRYTYHLIESLAEIDGDNEYILHAPKSIFDLKRRLPGFPKHKNLKRYPDYFKQGFSGRYDIYHYPCPDQMDAKASKLVVTVHDLIYKTFPKGHTQQTIELTAKYMDAIVRKADMIICSSASTRRDLHEHFHLPLEKSRVIHNGVDHRIFYPLPQAEYGAAAQEIKNLGINGPFLLYVGTIEPRKNLSGLLEAFAALKGRKAFAGKLVVVGMKGWMVENIQQQLKKLGIAGQVLFTGFLSDVQLRALYNLTEVFVFPSFYEGFGFPILEAFCCGAAVVASQNSSCGEIAINTALTIDPNDTAALSVAIERVLGDNNFKSRLCEAGLKRAQEFSFEKTAQTTLALYEKLAGEPKFAVPAV